ncbi:MAG: zf-HC2 domain-containing protein [Planctomycetota bacterium]
MECTNAGRLIASYLDGELSEAQAAPLRKHLLACQPCRAAAQGEKNLKRWFVASPSVAVPQDFAARVARRAFAGDRGAGERGAGFVPAAAPVARPSEDRTLRFVLQVTALAATLLVVAAIALSSLKLPSGNRLAAENQPTLEQALEGLDRLEREAATTQSPSSDQTADARSQASPPTSQSKGSEPK